MTVRRQLFFVRWLLWLACVVAIFVVARRTQPPISWIFAIALLGGMPVVRRIATKLVARRAFVRLKRFAQERRYAEARRLLADLRGVYAHSPLALEHMRLHEGSLLAQEGRYAEAARVFEAIDRRRVGRGLPLLLNNLAWCLVRTGKGPRALVLARESIAAGDGGLSGGDLQACQLGTLGAALVTDGKPDEAIAPLERALACGGVPRHQAVRAFYLGEALHAVGREDEAVLAWQRAAKACPDDGVAVEAKDRLRRHAPYRS